LRLALKRGEHCSIMTRLTLAVLFEFSASHRLYRADLSDADNSKLFGKCANKNGHGHNYILEVRVGGDIDHYTGMLLDASVLKELVESLVINDVDHKDLNRDTPWLEGRIPTTEVLAQSIFERIAEAVSKRAPNAYLDSITLHETRRISVTVNRSDL
jgi:6-pyruvoyltetrahydropterin/6-carboxytetrahydropterin synthase